MKNIQKNIVSLQLMEKSSGFAIRFLALKCRKFQKLQGKVKFRRNADLLICNLGHSYNLNGG